MDRLPDNVLDRAASDDAFACCLIAGRSTAARHAGFDLGAVESFVLDHIPSRVLRSLIAARHRRARRLLGGAAGAIAAAAMLATGCDLFSTDDPGPAPAARAPTDTTDTDGDGMPDWWETTFGLDPTDDGSVDLANGPNGDPDGDSILNNEEYWSYTDPWDSAETDTDGDGMPDAFEIVHQTPTDPGLATGLDPSDDGTTVFDHGADGDPDLDGYTNYDEYRHLSDPTDASSTPFLDPMGGCLPSSDFGTTPLVSAAALALALARLRRRWRLTAG